MRTAGVEYGGGVRLVFTSFFPCFSIFLCLLFMHLNTRVSYLSHSPAPKSSSLSCWTASMRTSTASR